MQDMKRRNSDCALLRCGAWMADSVMGPGGGLGAAVIDLRSSQDDPHFFSSLGGFSSSTRMGMLITLWSVRGSGKTVISTLTTSFLL